MLDATAILVRGRFSAFVQRETGAFIMAVMILVFGFYLLYPIVLLLIMSFNTAQDVLVGPAQWGIGNWITAWNHPQLLRSLRNTFLIWFLVAAISFPIAIVISLILARTRVPFSYGLEYMFWVAYMFPNLSTTIGWMMMLDPDVGFINRALEALPFIDKGPFNIFSVPGIVWTKLMGDGIAFKVMLITPAFRNMNQALEDAARVSGASKVGTMMKVTIPLMISPIALVLALQLLRVFGGFETEYLLGSGWGFWVYSTLIFKLTSQDVPRYSQAIALASITLLIIAVIFPMQRWIVQRRQYTTVTGDFKPGLIDLGRWKWPIFGSVAALLALLTVVPFIALVVGTFMTRAGFFEATPLWTLSHWKFVLTDAMFMRGIQTTLILAITGGIGSPLLFSVIAYMIVRTRWKGRAMLDSIIWVSAAFPGILSSLGLLLMFLSTPGLSWLYGSIWALMLVVIISGNTTGTNIFKGVLVQLGKDLEEAGRVAGAGWLRNYIFIVIPVLMPTMVLIGALNFISAASTTSSIILLASRETITLSLLGLELASPEVSRREAAGVVSLVIMALTLGLALIARTFGLRVGLPQERTGKR
jgi:iron(III) transport system permease protein